MSPFSTLMSENVSVVIVTFNSADVVEGALQSIPPGAEVIVVDNASTDASLDCARRTGARCIRNSENLGFGAACNIGARAATRDFILFLNPDAIMMPGALELMLEAALHHPDAGAVGPKLIDERRESIWRYTSPLHPISPLAQMAPQEPEALCCLPLLTGAALLCRRAALEDISGFDEEIFLYYEDDDLCVRMRKHGWSLIYEPAAVVLHLNGQSTPRSLDVTRFKSRFRVLSHIYISRKYGLHIDLARELRRTIKRLVIASILFDSERRAAAMGRLDALVILRRGHSGRGSRKIAGVKQIGSGIRSNPFPSSSKHLVAQRPDRTSEDRMKIKMDR